MANLLLVDDEPDLLELLGYILAKEGYKVRTAGDGLQALAAIREALPDVIVLDMMMPHMDGLQLLREIRAEQSQVRIPVLMLTARSTVEDRIAGLEAGADDYLAKPFSNKELILRLRSLLRRAASTEQFTRLGPLYLEHESLGLVIDGVRTDLTATEFKLLLMLMQHPDQVQTRDLLLRDVWGYKDSTLTRTLDTHIKRLREKLGEHADLLQTARGVGYFLKSLP